MSMVSCRAHGAIYMESTGEEARFDVDMEWPALEAKPDEMAVLHYLMDTGDIQILLDGVEENP